MSVCFFAGGATFRGHTKSRFFRGPTLHRESPKMGFGKSRVYSSGFGSGGGSEE